ncbi:MAG: hypothetical protein RJA57_1761 [Bacteroidota bacterium]|jgi:YegS/Rv2252/BmrU family lipid kinase
MRRILYIVNPVAGTRSKKGLITLIENRTTEMGIPFEIVTSAANGDYTEWRQRIRTESITDVVIAGGDGTVSQAIGSLVDLPVRFGILPCGSGNGLAHAARIPASTEKALDLVRTGEARPTDAFRINGKFACMLCGLGFDAEVAHAFARQKKRGLPTYVKQTLLQFFRTKSHSFDVVTPERSFYTEAFFISVANSDQFGNHVTIAPRARLDDGLLDVVIFPRQNKLRWIGRALRQLRGGNPPVNPGALNEKAGILYFQTDRLEIRNPGQAALHIDGDPAATATVFSIRVAPGCFRLIRP